MNTSGNKKKSSDKEDQNPLNKVIRTILWFVIFGSVALLINHLLDDGEHETSSLNTAGDKATPGLSFQNRTPVKNKKDKEELLDIINEKFLKKPTQIILDDGGKYMYQFYSALYKLDKLKEKDTVDILHYGDSILTTDELSGSARKILQKRFGDAGHGFVLMGKPWRWYKHLDVEPKANNKWSIRPITSGPLKDGMFGLGGVAFKTRKAGAKAGVKIINESKGSKASFDLSYLKQPGGGSFEIITDNQDKILVNTEAEKKITEHLNINVASGKTEFKVETKGDGPVRLFGVNITNGLSGVRYHSLSINGARAVAMFRYDEAHWKKEIEHTNPSLVILMFGANAGHNKSLVLEKYSKHLSKLLKIFRKSAPDASCLVVGPMDQAERKSSGTVKSLKMPGKLSTVQRKVALSDGCAFFDVYSVMKDGGGMKEWHKKGLAGGDFIHPTEFGARLIGKWLTEAMLFGYENFIREKKNANKM